MKSRIVRVLSIGGMLVTAPTIAVIGNAAGSTPVSASASSSSSPTTTPSSVSTASAAPVTVAPTPVPGSATQFSYVVGDAATVVVDSAGGILRVVSFAPNPGWFTIRLEQSSVTALQALLESPGGQVRFGASLADGSVVTSLEVGGPGSFVPGSTAPGNTAPGNSAPDNSTPGNSTPGNSTPGNSTPGNTAPGGGDDNGGDDNSGSGGGGNDDSGGDDSGGSGGGGSDD